MNKLQIFHFIQIGFGGYAWDLKRKKKQQYNTNETHFVWKRAQFDMNNWVIKLYNFGSAKTLNSWTSWNVCGGYWANANQTGERGQSFSKTKKMFAICLAKGNLELLHLLFLNRKNRFSEEPISCV